MPLLACSLLLFAQNGITQDGTLRERLKQRWTSRLPSPSAIASRIDSPGGYTFPIMRDGLARMYRVHVPRTYSVQSPASLALAFHGGGVI